MILVATGTHHQPFERLVRAADELGRLVCDVVVLQRGTARGPALHCSDHRYLTPDRFQECLREARVVVLHAGSSSFLEARAYGRTPILVPRRPEHGEHVDDHQVRFARSVTDQARVVEPHQLCTAVLHHLDEARAPDPDGRSRAFARRLQAAIAPLLEPAQ